MRHLVDILIGLFAVSCVTIIWVRGEPFSAFKQWMVDTAGRFDVWVAYLVSCTLCSGVWIGFISYIFLQPELLRKPWWMELPLWAAMVGVTAMALDRKIWNHSVFLEPSRMKSIPASTASEEHIRS